MVLNLDDPGFAPLQATLEQRGLDVWGLCHPPACPPAGTRPACAAEGLRLPWWRVRSACTAKPADWSKNVSNLLGVIAALRSLGAAGASRGSVCPVQPRAQARGAGSACRAALVAVDHAHTLTP